MFSKSKQMNIGMHLTIYQRLDKVFGKCYIYIYIYSKSHHIWNKNIHGITSGDKIQLQVEKESKAKKEKMLFVTFQLLKLGKPIINFESTHDLLKLLKEENNYNK